MAAAVGGGGGGAATVAPGVEPTWRRLTAGTAIGSIPLGGIVFNAAPAAQWIAERRRVAEAGVAMIGVPPSVRAGKPIDTASVQQFVAENADPAKEFRYPLTPLQDRTFNRWADQRLGAAGADREQQRRVKTENDDAHWYLSAGWIARVMEADPRGRHTAQLGWLMGICEANISAVRAFRRAHRDKFADTHDVSALYDWAYQRSQQYKADGRSDYVAAVWQDFEFQDRAAALPRPPTLGALRKALKMRNQTRPK